ncbi:MAG: class I SAM-dependent methyltransferase [Zetaproteobacteria bacterium]|nr:class I SAM-dependent methyltransferase [Zetaproteobacteria bacterium]
MPLQPTADKKTSHGPNAPRDWETQYREDDVETMPWFYAALDADVEKALTHYSHNITSALDLGAGAASQAIALAKRGVRVTATDIAHSAMQKAAMRAHHEGVSIHCQQDDILQSTLTDHFDLIIDRGCFHCISGDARQTYVEKVHQLTNPQGWLLLKTFHIDETGKEGPPNRYHPDDIARIFGSHFELIDAYTTIFHGSRDCAPIALFSILRKK